MVNLLLRRAAAGLFTIFVVMTLIFFIVRVVPGDPAQVVLGDQANQKSLEELREQMGLNASIVAQYFTFLGGVVKGDWGISLITGRSVINEITKVLPRTVELAFAGLTIGCLLGIPFGVWAAVNRNNQIDYVVRVVSLVGISFPAFVSGILLILLFSVQLQWFPVISIGGDGPLDHLRHLALPALNLGILMAAYTTRVTRAAMLEVLQEDYVRTAKAKGVPNQIVLWRHCFRNALLPVVTIVGLYLGVLMGGAVLTEIVFNRPGLGRLIVGALNQRDYTMLQGLIVVYTLFIVSANTLTDLVYGLIDPRIKYS